MPDKTGLIQLPIKTILRAPPRHGQLRVSRIYAGVCFLTVRKQQVSRLTAE